MVCLSTICINTLHEGDNDDDDDDDDDDDNNNNNNNNNNNTSETNKPFPRFFLLNVIPFWPITANGPSLTNQSFFQKQSVIDKN